MKKYCIIILLLSILTLTGCGTKPASSDLILTSGGLTLTMNTIPDAPRPMQTTEIVLRLTDEAGNSVPDAKIVLNLSMPSTQMHGNQAELTNSGNGLYLSPVMFTMSGEWEMKVEVAVQDQKETFKFNMTTK
jgi:hypothetical protein